MKEPGERKEQITLTLKAKMIDRLPTGRGETSNLIAELLYQHWEKQDNEDKN